MEIVGIKIYSVMQTVELRVGMSCEGCVGAVKRVLGKMEGWFSSPFIDMVFLSVLFYLNPCNWN